MTVDPQRLRRLTSALASYGERLAALSAMPIETYLTEEAFAGRYLVQATAQTCLDAANHLIASQHWRVPTDYRDAFTVLEEHHVLDAALAVRLRALAGLRNRLVHLYDDIDDRLVHGFLPAGLDDVEAFATALARLAADAGHGEEPDSAR